MIETRPARDTDRGRCIWIEAGAIQGIRYINDVWPLFLGGGDGELTLALEDGQVGGMGKLSHLYGPYCWLESLRVHPDFQNRGLGKAIYRRYMEQMEQRGLTACGMYTGTDNTHSRHLAELFGLELRGRFAEYSRPVAGGGAASLPDDHGFSAVAATEGEALLAPHYGEMGDFAVLNRTWLPVRPGLGEALAARGWLWRGPGDTLLVAGSRFQPHRAVHIPFVRGDTQAALAFALRLARLAGASALTAVRPWGDAAAQAGLEAMGFAYAGQDIITLWKDL